VEVSVEDAAPSGMDASPGEGDITETKAREVKTERSSAKEAPTKGEDDPWPERPTKEEAPTEREDDPRNERLTKEDEDGGPPW
jgi:hypothetical protein